MSSAPLDFVLFYVSDLDASLTYYTEQLGFERVPEQEGPGFRYLTCGQGVDFGLQQADDKTAAPGVVQLYFKTADAAQTRETLTGRGVDATPIVHMPFGTIFTMHSPDGNPLTMLQPPAH